jgi:uncharacterized membrane protein
MSDSHVKSAVKAVTWRVVGAADTFILSWLLTGRPTLAGVIVGVETVTKSLLYYAHERAWAAARARRVVERIGTAIAGKTDPLHIGVAILLILATFAIGFSIPLGPRVKIQSRDWAPALIAPVTYRDC